MQKTVLKYVFLLILSADICYSFLQHYNQPLDGDMPGGIVPAEDVKKVLSDPFGISVILDYEFYPNPNRFFSHWAYQKYFINGPAFFQNFISPINSIYFSAAIIKTLLQISLIFLLAVFILPQKPIRSFDFLICLMLVFPLFQTNGWQSQMGIIDASVTYTFFYALPMVFLLIFYIPVYRWLYHGTKMKFENTIFIMGILLSILVSFSSPLIPGIVLIISFLLIIRFLHFIYTMDTNRQNVVMKQIFHLNRKWVMLFIFLNLISIYSLYIGRNNSIFYGNELSIADRYGRLPIGLFRLFTDRIGWGILFGFIVVNLLLFKRIKTEESLKLIGLYKWILLFSVIYILLLPLGGYKVYRPMIIRYDTFLPVTICVFFVFGSSTFLLLKHLSGKNNSVYLISLILVLAVFTISDEPAFDKNDCEKQALEKISGSDENKVVLHCDCTVISWDKMSDSKNSELIGALLFQWNITDELKTFNHTK